MLSNEVTGQRVCERLSAPCLRKRQCRAAITVNQRAKAVARFPVPDIHFELRVTRGEIRSPGRLDDNMAVTGTC